MDVQLEIAPLIRDLPELAVLRHPGALAPRLKEVTLDPVELRPPDRQALRELLPQLRERGQQLVLVGGPSALRRASSLAGSVEQIRHPDAPLPEAGKILVLLEGPTWADRYAERADAAGIPVLVCSSKSDAPPGGWWLEDAGDGRFGGLSAVTMLLAAWAGAELGELEEAEEGVRSACQKAALADNPALLWGATISLLLRPEGDGRGGHVHLVSEGAQQGAATQVARSMGAVLNEVPTVAGRRRPLSLHSRVGSLGDEEELSEGGGGARDRLYTLWSQRGTDAELLGRAREHLRRAGLAVLGLRLAEGPRGLVAAVA
ncbi:MAG TPA: hypothetical protein PKY30_04850, partial [Myxococcota bacterium]|nr:hypothetical protein [Myxococcota bacterium]